MTEHKLAHILRAIADGKVVQVRAVTRYPYPRGDEVGFWCDLDTSTAFSLFPDCRSIEYRIKPKPLVKKWRWVFKSVYAGIGISTEHYRSEEEFNSGHPNYKAVQRIDSTMIEVEED